MTARETFSIPTELERKIRELGYEVDHTMDACIAEWWAWYTAQDDWHDLLYPTAEGGYAKRRRLSLHPARRACREWSRLILNEATAVAVEKPKANEWLAGYLADVGYWPTTQALADRSFGVGTAAQALWFDVRDGEVADIKPRGYDARMTVPLSWDMEGVTECAFCTRVSVRGRKAHQLQVHKAEDGQYVVYTYVFQDGTGAAIAPEECGIIEKFETGCPVPTFGIMRPGIENTRVDLSPYGVSVFDDAMDAMKAVDLAYDSIFQELELTEAMVFMSDDMIDVRKDANGKPVAVPKGKDRKLFRMVEGNGVEQMYQVYSPQVRIEPMRQALDVALAEFGDLAGFGQDYFALDKKAGLKTATEVSADNSALMRNIRRHENSIAQGIVSVASALLHCARIHLGAPVEEDFGKVEVRFDDSIITDTQAEKNMMLAEIAAGVVPKWMYLKEFKGMSEEEAKAALPQEPVLELGL